MAIADMSDALERAGRAVDVLVWKRDRNGLPEAVLTLGSSPWKRRDGAGVRRGRGPWLTLAVVWRGCAGVKGKGEEDHFNDEGRVREKDCAQPQRSFREYTLRRDCHHLNRLCCFP